MKPVFQFCAVLLSLTICLTGFSGPANAGEKIDSANANPLEPFSRLVGGQWHLENTYHAVEWGVGKKSVVVSSYVESDGETNLVSEGFWFWHPGEQQIRGYFVATGMGIDLYEYTTRFEGDKMVNQLVGYGRYGGQFEEIWKFTGPDHYEWSLFQKTAEGNQKMMDGTFERK